MNRVPVVSSTLASVSYSADQRILDVEFCSGAVYRYFDVPTDIYSQLLEAESKGRFFNANVRNCFCYREIPSRRYIATPAAKF